MIHQHKKDDPVLINSEKYQDVPPNTKGIIRSLMDQGYAVEFEAPWRDATNKPRDGKRTFFFVERELTKAD